MITVYLIIVWVVCLSYIGFNLYHHDFVGRVFAAIIFILAVIYSIVVLSI